MNLSYFGSTIDQAQAGAVLRLSADDKNVSPYELVAYAQAQGYLSQRLINGSTDLARTLLSNGIPVLVETWHEDAPNDGLGHYRLLVGYDDALQQWTVYDSYDRTNLIAAEPYGGLRFCVWRDGRAVEGVQPCLCARLPARPRARWWRRSWPPTGRTPATHVGGAAAQAQAEIAANPADAFAWFNLGSSLTAQGLYADAAAAFDQARAIGLPWRMLWYQFEHFRRLPGEWGGAGCDGAGRRGHTPSPPASRRFTTGAGGRWRRWATPPAPRKPSSRRWRSTGLCRRRWS